VMRPPTCPLMDRMWPSPVAVIVAPASHPSIVWVLEQRRPARATA
jgi:hypothetical protein